MLLLVNFPASQVKINVIFVWPWGRLLCSENIIQIAGQATLYTKWVTFFGTLTIFHNTFCLHQFLQIHTIVCKSHLFALQFVKSPDSLYNLQIYRFTLQFAKSTDS